jgi:hypothetical protein
MNRELREALEAGLEIEDYAGAVFVYEGKQYKGLVSTPTFEEKMMNAGYEQRVDIRIQATVGQFRTLPLAEKKSLTYNGKQWLARSIDYSNDGYVIFECVKR